MSLPNELRRSLRALSAPASHQLDLFPDLRRSADALALDFGLWRDTVVDNESNPLSGAQARALADLDAQLIAMSGQQNLHLWTEEALRESPVWQRVRNLAQMALTELGWAEEPSPKRSQMKRLTPKQVRAIIGTTTLVATLAGLDIWAAMRLVRGHMQLPVTITSVESICPLDDSSGGRSLVAGVLEQVARAKLSALPPCRRDMHVPHERLLELSPFPPLLQETAASSAGPVAGSTVIDTADEGRLQLTVVYGPADSTPSRFVPRAPGDAAFAKNFRVTYLFLHEPGPTLEPKLRFVAWRAVEIQGDGARIAALSLSFAAAEAVIVLMLFGAFLRGRRKPPTALLPH